MKKILLAIGLVATLGFGEMMEGKNYKCWDEIKKDYYHLKIISPDAILVKDYLFEFNYSSKVYIGDIGGSKIYMGLYPKDYKIRMFNFNSTAKCVEE